MFDKPTPQFYIAGGSGLDFFFGISHIAPYADVGGVRCPNEGIGKGGCPSEDAAAGRGCMQKNGAVASLINMYKILTNPELPHMHIMLYSIENGLLERILPGLSFSLVKNRKNA